METLLICLLLLYNAYLVFTLLKGKQQEKQHSGKETAKRGNGMEEHADILGKSRFKMEAKTPQAAQQTPQAAISAEVEDVTDIAVTFADETGQPAPARLPDDQLDEAFTHIRTSDILPDEEEAGAEDNASVAGYATGASFEAIGDAVQVADSPKATQEAGYRAGRIFTEMEGNELFRQLLDSSSRRASRITALMDAFFSNPAPRGETVAGEVTQLPNHIEVPSDISQFDIRDFV